MKLTEDDLAKVSKCDLLNNQANSDLSVLISYYRNHLNKRYTLDEPVVKLLETVFAKLSKCEVDEHERRAVITAIGRAINAIEINTPLHGYPPPDLSQLQG
jgi:hypothetical protein